jgi:hypothetical protein
MNRQKSSEEALKKAGCGIASRPWWAGRHDTRVGLIIAEHAEDAQDGVIKLKALLQKNL